MASLGVLKVSGQIVSNDVLDKMHDRVSNYTKPGKDESVPDGYKQIITIREAGFGFLEPLEERCYGERQVL